MWIHIHCTQCKVVQSSFILQERDEEISSFVVFTCIDGTRVQQIYWEDEQEEKSGGRAIKKSIGKEERVRCM